MLMTMATTYGGGKRHGIMALNYVGHLAIEKIHTGNRMEEEKKMHLRKPVNCLHRDDAGSIFYVYSG